MQTRRDFLRNAAVLTGTSFVWGSVPEAIAKAMAIDPESGTTFHDAEHVVILMQENRSFDHCYGALQGVRGFRDPRAHTLPNGNPVWFQTDKAGNTYAPFRLDMKGSNVTWIGGLPHSWTDQVDARNGGHYDKWLIAKPRKEFPFTLGHYDRRDLPFYYALADAFTVCDQAFCSSLTGTTPNRLFLWTGNIRKDKNDFPRVQNGDTDYDAEASWTTFPERLEDAGVSWRIYQNEISYDTGFEGEQDSWLSNFTDNPIEWFTQYRVRFSKSRRNHLAKMMEVLPKEIVAKEKSLQAADMTKEAGEKLNKEVTDLRARLNESEAEHALYHDESWSALSSRDKALHEKAFITNEGDPDYRSLTTLRYKDGDKEREVQVPKGDTLHRFRKDVETGRLPAVSWIVAPENFSDHPGAAWYGAWYVSEVLDILTKDPEVWKKTVFILCYDENDGYFDHVPPFTAPHPDRPETGKTSEGLDTAVDWANVHGRDHSIGLGYRVPLVIASPWSRGGCVNSQVFDHTSIIQFVETWLSGKGKNVRETNISDWRRTVCGDLTSTFRSYNGEKLKLPQPLDRDATVETIHAAKFKDSPKAGKALTAEEIEKANVGSAQEPGTRPSCPLPYELTVNAERVGDQLRVAMEAHDTAFGEKAQGAPFNAYSLVLTQKHGQMSAIRAYAVQPGKVVTDEFPTGDTYVVRIDGPNGFLREFLEDVTMSHGMGAKVRCLGGKKPSGKVEIRLSKLGDGEASVEIHNKAYGTPVQRKIFKAGEERTVIIDTAKNHGWYDFTIQAEGLAYRYAGRVETGKWSITDPAMGGS
ncbi:phospholipase C, phosphocholine-specific [soil metagenome]